MLNNKTIFVSGGTGSFGQEFVNQVLKKLDQKKLLFLAETSSNNLR